LTRFTGPRSTADLLRQWGALRPDHHVDRAARARLRRNRVWATGGCVALLCLVAVLAGDWVAVVASACFVVPCVAYWALISKPPSDPGAGDGER
jgi:hypothetical protein